jgi:hypothetical protein
LREAKPVCSNGTRPVLANLLLFLTASVIAVKLLDFYMSDDQKKRLNDRVVRVWNWLDEAKRVPLLDMARTPRSQRILVAVAICAIFALNSAVVIWSDLLGIEFKMEYFTEFPVLTIFEIVILLIFVPITVWLGKWLISIIWRGKTALQLFGRMSLIFILVILPLSIGMYFLANIVDQDNNNAYLGSDYFPLFLLASFIGAIVNGFMSMFWAASAGLVLFIYVGSLLLYVAELTARRIAEYPKGPLLAGSVLVGSVVALTKALGVG